MELWTMQIPTPVVLAVLCLIGYMAIRKTPATNTDVMIRSRRELKRAQTVARELENISRVVRQHLAEHHSSVSRFRERVNRLHHNQQDAAWKELCQEAEDILKPTLKLASQIANAYDEIRQQSANLMTFTEVRTDPLTGVNNRRGLDDSLAAQYALMTRYRSIFSIVMIDIDHFKQVNDQSGHLHGDHVLQELARIIEESVRETDLVARYGGEEFVIVLPQTDLIGACEFADRLRMEVDRQLEITVSGGVAMAQLEDTPEVLIARADMALYHAKAAGRNRVFRHTDDGAELVVREEVTSNPA
jgi:diguanylate cyclase